MKAYGVKRKDKICCAAHSKYAALDNQCGEKLERRQRPAKKSARQAGKKEAKYD